MPYCTLAQLTDRYGAAMLRQLTDRATPPAGAVDEAVVNRAIADTDATIDGYLAGRYVLPLTEVPVLLADLALAIAIYKLHVTAVTEKIAEDYTGALRMLREIASGTVRLNVAGIEPVGNQASGVRATDREREVTAENMRGFV